MLGGLFIKPILTKVQLFRRQEYNEEFENRSQINVFRAFVLLSIDLMEINLNYSSSKVTENQTFCSKSTNNCFPLLMTVL